MVVIRERDQIETEDVSAAWFLRSADFQAGPTMCALADPHASMLIIMIRATKR